MRFFTESDVTESLDGDPAPPTSNEHGGAASNLANLWIWDQQNHLTLNLKMLYLIRRLVGRIRVRCVLFGIRKLLLKHTFRGGSRRDILTGSGAGAVCGPSLVRGKPRGQGAQMGRNRRLAGGICFCCV